MGQIQVKTRFQKLAAQEKNAYVSRAVRFSKIPTAELIEHAASDSGLSDSMVAGAFYAIVKQVKELMLNGHSIELGTLGTLRFSMSCKAAKTAEDVSAANVKTRRILIAPSKTLKQALANVTFTGFSAGEDNEASGEEGEDDELA
jgi:predicted histone-like DNA-binding protein